MNRSRPDRRAAALAALLLLAACASGADAAPAPARNLIVISVDTLRADRLGCYGHDRPTSPAIDSIAAGGAVFEQAWATSPWTKPSHASLLTGLYPGHNGADTMKSSLSPEAVHLASWLSARGFQTAAVVNASWLKMQGLERGFDSLEWIKFVQGRREGSPVAHEAIRWLAQRDRERPFFALFHFMDVHSDYASLPRYERMFVEPYEGPVDGSTQQLYRFAEGKAVLDEAGRRHLLDLYDAGIRQVDEQIRRLLDYLRAQKLLEDSLLIFVSDHGEEFLEHGSMIHGHTQYEEVLRIPLILSGPGIPARRIATPVSLVDVMPTALALLGQPVPPGLDGRSLQPLWQDGAPAPRLLFAEADVTFPPPAPGFVPAGPNRAARGGRFKLHYDVESGRARLFDLVEDPAESVDVSEAQPDAAALLLRHLRRHLSGQAALPLNETELRLLAGPE